MKRKSPLVAALLQCIPLLGAGSCIANGATDLGFDWVVFLWWSVLLWGLGYAYLDRMRRFLVWGLAGPLLAIGSCFASFSGVSYDFEHNTRSEDRPAANRAAVQTGLLVSLAVLLLAVDAARLAAARNAGPDDPDAADAKGSDDPPGRH